MASLGQTTVTRNAVAMISKKHRPSQHGAFVAVKLVLNVRPPAMRWSSGVFSLRLSLSVMRPGLE